jgi:hypothetical protein
MAGACGIVAYGCCRLGRPKRAEVVRVTNAVLEAARAVFVALGEALS